MYHLAFETSCDDTSIALMRDDRVLRLITQSQLREHIETGGVVPEVAARLHANVIFDVLRDIFDSSSPLENGGSSLLNSKGEHLSLKDIAYIECTSEPGLLPSLLVGKTVAKTLAHALQIPLFWINHIEGHIFANLLERSIEDIPFPAVVLTVSGGHNEIYLWKSLYDWELLGQTRDDAAGEAFDKVAKAMGLGFPGGPLIAKLASEYTGIHRWIFPVPLLEKESLDFSFSWLKSSVRREIESRKTHAGNLSEADMREIAFEFEQAVVATLVAKLERAAEHVGVTTVMLAGWVSANDFLRKSIAESAEARGYRFFAPIKKVYSMDNAAMIGIRWYYEWLRTNGQFAKS